MDKRREKRIIERDAVFIKSADEHKDTTYGVGITAYTYDLSLGGARIFSEKFFAVGTVIRIVIELARTNQSVQIDGEVKWARERDDEGLYEMGVEFLHNISQTILSLIRHLYGAKDAAASTFPAYEPGPQPEVQAEAGGGNGSGQQAHQAVAEAGTGPTNGAGKRPARKRTKKRKAVAKPQEPPEPSANSPLRP